MELMEVHEEADMLASIAAPHGKSSLQDADDELSKFAPGVEHAAQTKRCAATDTEPLIIENKV